MTGYGGCGMEKQFFWCISCGSCWREDDTSLLDIECPNCCDTFYDGNVESISQDEFDEIDEIDKAI